MACARDCPEPVCHHAGDLQRHSAQPCRSHSTPHLTPLSCRSCSDEAQPLKDIWLVPGTVQNDVPPCNRSAIPLLTWRDRKVSVWWWLGPKADSTARSAKAIGRPWETCSRHRTHGTRILHCLGDLPRPLGDTQICRSRPTQFPRRSPRSFCGLRRP